MDGSNHLGQTQPTDATRVALRVDRDAVGLMRHASRLSHLIEWWLEGGTSALDAMAAFRIGRRLERFRLAARLAEGRSSNQVRVTLDGLRSEVLRHPAPNELLVELQAALRESERLKASAEPPPTLLREAFNTETSAAAAEFELVSTPRRRPAPWLLVAAALAGAAWWLVRAGTVPFT